jgi:molecular chaperone HscB
VRPAAPSSAASADVPDHFALFGLKPAFALDLDRLERAYKDLQGRVHPDRFAAASPAERRVAMQWAALANEAYRTLRSPLPRAAYMCALRGTSVDGPGAAPAPAAFLAQQMGWREQLHEAQSPLEVEALARQVAVEQDGLLAELAVALDDRADFQAAAGLVSRLMFIDKFLSDLASVRERQASPA